MGTSNLAGEVARSDLFARVKSNYCIKSEDSQAARLYLFPFDTMPISLTINIHLIRIIDGCGSSSQGSSEKRSE